MKNLKATVLIIMVSISAYAQQPVRTNRFPAGTFHQKNLNINGISVGLYTGFGDFGDSVANVHTNGMRLEAVGMGILSPLLPKSPISEDDRQFNALMATPASEQINGFNLSPAGTMCDCITNGVSAGAIGQYNRQVNGLSASIVINLAEKHNGVQLAMFNESFAMNGLQIGVSNYAQRSRGIQIGLFNQSKNLKGIQLGLWNKNQRRKLPILNWNFKD
jgi:hypothetical protein